MFASPITAQERQEKEATKSPIGQFITVGSPIDDQIFARVSNAAIKLQGAAAQEGRPAYLVLQIEPGTSQFHQVQGLAKFLTSAQVSNVTTVAWIPRTVTGPNALIALACRQIVMHPEAELGDIGRGKPLDPDDRQGVLAIAQKRHNPKVNPALARAMIDQDAQLWKVRIRTGNKDELETRLMSKDELEAIGKTSVEIDRADVIKEAGIVGTFQGASARSQDILVVQTADSRSAVADWLSLPREALREQVDDIDSKRVRLIRVEGRIDSLQETFLVRQIERAVAAGAKVIVFEIDSPGGRLQSSFDLANAIARLEDQKVRTIAYIPEMALSGAAIVSLGCDEIIMRPTARIGDAAPIEIRPGQPFERAPEKVLSDMQVMMAGLARKKNRPVALCMAMADRRMKVFQVTHRDNGRTWYMSETEVQAAGEEWIVGRQLPETNGELLLTVNGERAHELKLADSPVHDMDELKVRIGLPATAPMLPIGRTWVDSLVFVLNSPALTVILLILGIALIFVENQFMTGYLGILSVLCFALFFWSRFLGGTAGWLEVVLFVLGIGCLALEIFVIPGFGVFGISGIMMILASLVMAGHSWSYDVMTNMEGLAVQAGWVLLAFALVGCMAYTTFRYMPQLPMFETMILTPPDSLAQAEPQLRLPAVDSTTGQEGGLAVGQQGICLTLLRPSGKARMNGLIVNVVSEGPFIQAQSVIEIVEVSGNRVVVRQI
jgi:membrane-bound serine protease (ClpP class)